VILRAALMLLAAPAAALDMPLPATVTLSETLPLAAHRVATGPFADGTWPQVTAEGGLTRTVHRMTAADVTPLQLLAPLRDQLEAEGWEIVFSCAARTCGGFAFRFEIDVAPAPVMFLDLAAYRYLAARRDGAWTTLVVSVSEGVGYVQRVTVAPSDAVAALPRTSAAPAPPPVVSDGSDVASALAATGRAVLADLAFPTGATDLPGDSYASLEALAAFLEANPGTTIALVGHTDAQGGAEGNMAISRRRADSARGLLTGRYGADPARVEAFGMGYFAPIARNDSPEGRERNRRVEAVITSTD
jgi:OOP family OmpA-OmpF porin